MEHTNFCSMLIVLIHFEKRVAPLKESTNIDKHIMKVSLQMITEKNKQYSYLDSRTINKFIK